MGKLFIWILNDRLTSWAEEYYVFIEPHAVFTAAMSTVDNVFVLHGIINHLLNKGENSFVLLWISEKLLIMLFVM